MEVILIAKEKLTTELMQAAGVFEPFKFIGNHLAVDVELPSKKKKYTAQEILDIVGKYNDADFVMVGVIIPRVGAAFKEGYKILSTGDQWITLVDMCRSYEVEPPMSVKFGA